MWNWGQPQSTLNSFNCPRVLLNTNQTVIRGKMHLLLSCTLHNMFQQISLPYSTLFIDKFSVLKEKFRREPIDVNVARGDMTHLVCEPPRGNPIPTVFWKKDGKLLDLENQERWVTINLYGFFKSLIKSPYVLKIIRSKKSLFFQHLILLP